MKRCDPHVRAKCPDGKRCELYAVFADGSECDKFNEQVLSQPMSDMTTDPEKCLVSQFRNEAMAEFIRLCKGNDFNKLTLLMIGDTIDRLHDKFSAIPTVDAVEVVHGRYIQKPYDEWWAPYYVCLECGTRMMVADEEGRIIKPNFCPNCGAKMDGDGNG